MDPEELQSCQAAGSECAESCLSPLTHGDSGLALLNQRLQGLKQDQTAGSYSLFSLTPGSRI